MTTIQPEVAAPGDDDFVARLLPLDASGASLS